MHSKSSGANSKNKIVTGFLRLLLTCLHELLQARGDHAGTTFARQQIHGHHTQRLDILRILISKKKKTTKNLRSDFDWQSETAHGERIDAICVEKFR
jgi:hypothetical protein